MVEQVDQVAGFELDSLQGFVHSPAAIAAFAPEFPVSLFVDRVEEFL